jgi:hypothetical protein
MIKNGTYHRQLGPLPGRGHWHGSIELVYSEHAIKAASEDRYGPLPRFGCVEFDAALDVVEVTMENGEPVKAVLRIPVDDRLDVVYVLLRPEAGRALVKTMWGNLGSDAHSTLDKSKYVRL